MKTLLKEPLLQFILIGASLFSLYSWINPSALQSENTITVNKGQVNMLVEGFRKVWNREPRANELQGLVDDYVLEEIYYRQALAMGIDKNDPVIRRRLRQKMELLTSSLLDDETPTMEQLQRYLDSHGDRYRIAAQYSFEQRFIRLDQASTAIDAVVAEAQTRLSQGQEFSGDPSLVAQQFFHADSFEMNRVFGHGFAEKLAQLPLNEWQGPVRSGMGLHFIRIQLRTDARLPTLAEAKSAVERDWRYDHALEMKSTLKQKLLADYRIETPGLQGTTN